METYYIMTSDGELCHYGVKGMKWGVRKAEYKAMNRQQRKKTREEYYKTDEGKQYKIARNTVIGTVLGGPMIGVAAGLITAKRNGELQKRVNQGKNYVEKLATKRVVDIRSPFNESTRVTGDEEAEFWKALAENYEKDRP